MTGQTGDVKESGFQRACDQCRSRKIRCDKSSPCANCRTAHRTCSSIVNPPRPRETRQRVLITTQYEQKIDHLEHRLATIDQLLRQLNTSIHESVAGQPVVPSNFTLSTTGRIPSVTLDEKTIYSTFEGDSSINTQTTFASELLERAVQTTSWRGLSPDLRTALSSLQQIVGMDNQSSTDHKLHFPNQKPLPKGGLSELPMPPLHIVLTILREIKEKPPLNFSIAYCFITIEEFTACCQRVYFAIEDYTLATFIIVNGGLYYVLEERALNEPNEEFSREFLKYRDLCVNNLATILGNLNPFMPARLENVKALLLGSCYAIEASRPLLAWQMNCMTAQMCQTLGYHRLLPVSDSYAGKEINESKSSLFWFTYMLDKGLALRLGRASIIQDYDIAMPRYDREASAIDSPQRMLGLWTRHSEVQGKIYEQLYSFNASSIGPEQRYQSAQVLAKEIKSLLRNAKAMIEEHECKSDGWQHDSEKHNGLVMSLKSEIVTYYSTLTIIYRAIPPVPEAPGSFSLDCIEAAREALKHHLECMQLFAPAISAQAAYLHWTILFAPFIPVIVIFCHAIETLDADDQQRLEAFSRSLQSASSVSEAIDQLYRLAHVLHNIASVYIKSKKETDDQGMTLFGNDFDSYLSQQGFLPPTVEQMTVNGVSLTSLDDIFTFQTQDWLV